MKKILFVLAVVSTLGLASCDGFLDINTHPNQASKDNVTTGMLTPAIEMTLAHSYGNFLRIVGGFYSQQYAHLAGTSNYVDYSRFSMSAVRSSNMVYSHLNQRSLSNIKTVLEKAEAAEEWGTYLAATTLRAFIYQTLIDCYGEIPYTEALDDEITQPKYDDGKSVYEAVIAEIDAALAKATASDFVATNFLMPGETADSWIKFANAVKLRMLMRMADVSSDAVTKAGALITEGNFPTSDVAFAGCWSSDLGKMSPFYSEEFRDGVQKNVAANLAIVGTMIVKDADGAVLYQDPRLAAFFEPNTSGNYVGSVSGTQYPGGGASLGVSFWCRPVASYDMPVYLMTVAEIEFFKAEYYARNGSAAQAAAAYAAAIEASFASAGVEGAAAHVDRYPFDNANYKQSVGVQKWLALSGTNPFEAWCEVRRLDYPAMSNQVGESFYDDSTPAYTPNSYIPGTLYTPIMVFGEVGPGKLLERFPYPESSSSRNTNVPKFPGYTSPVFWAN